MTFQTCLLTWCAKTITFAYPVRLEHRRMELCYNLLITTEKQTPKERPNCKIEHVAFEPGQCKQHHCLTSCCHVI